MFIKDDDLHVIYETIPKAALYFGVPILTESNELLYSPKTHLSDMEFWSRFSKITV